jgi:cell division protein FtsW
MTLKERITAWLPSRKRDLPSELGERPAEASKGPDLWMVAAVLALTGFGIVMVFSAGAAFAAKMRIDHDWAYFLKRDAIFGAIGLFAFFVGMRLDYSVYRKLTYPLLILSLVLLAAVLKLGPIRNGAVRWYQYGSFSFQPSELGKFALVLYLSVLLARKAEKVRDFSMGFLPPLMMTGLFLGLLLKEPDLGTAVIFGATALGMMFVAGTRTSYILLLVLTAAPIGWKVFISGESWRMKRILAYLYPWQYRRDIGYQLYESLISVGSGGVWGQGLGQGHQKLFFLPEAHTDFILAVVGEELGLVGILAVLTSFGILVWRGIRAAMRARDPYGCYLAFGITSLFGLQAIVNMCVVLGLLPTKGLPLPFVSYGGSALVMSLFMAGVLANISARAPEPSRMTLWQSLRTVRGRSKNRRNGAANVQVVVEVR